MLKKYFVMLLMSGLVFAFVACGDKKEEAPLPEETIEGIIESVEETQEETDTAQAEVAPEPEIAPAPAAKDEKKPADKPATAAPAGDYTKTPLQGYVASLDGLVGGGTGKVSKDEANSIISRGGLLVFKAGNDVYFVYNEDGSFAAKRLASFANSSNVGLLGKTQTKGGIKIFIMNHIDAM